MRSTAFRPDGFAIGLFAFGVVMLFVPLMLMPGVIAIVSAVSYWLIMMALKASHRRHS
jgi:preprotein translocase subunit SecD